MSGINIMRGGYDMKQKQYQPYEVGRMEKAKRIKIARMLQESWK